MFNRPKKSSCIDEVFANELLGTKESLLCALREKTNTKPQSVIKINKFGEFWGSDIFIKEALDKFDRRLRPTEQSTGVQRIDEGYFEPIKKIIKEFEMFKKNKDRETKSLLKGAEYKTLTFGDRTSLSEFSIKKGSVIPNHKHPQEQTGYLISGRLVFTIDDERFDAEPGDSWNIASSLDHAAEALEYSVVIEVFSPAREDYLP